MTTSKRITAVIEQAEMIEQAAQKLQNWAKLPVDKAMLYFMFGYIVNIPELDELDTAITYLEYQKPGVAKSIKDEREMFNQLAIETNCAQKGLLQNATLLSTQKQAERLAKKLQHVAQLLNPEKQKGESKTPKKAKKTPLILLKKARETNARKMLDGNHSMTARALAEKLDCDPATVTRLKAWRENRKRQGQKPPNGFKRDHSSEGPDIDSYSSGPQEEHLDIKQMVEDYNEGNSPILPTTENIMNKLSLDNEKQAEQLFQETLHFFPNLEIKNT